MSLPEKFISCDWGTSKFRLNVVETKTLKLHHSSQSEDGIKNIYQSFIQSNKSNRTEFFSNFLKVQIEALDKKYQNLPILISGMASSNIGLLELPYAKMPMESDGSSINWRNVILHNGLEVLLISGVKSIDSMMRGEEIQALGLEESMRDHGNGTLILPGTHSKHITYNNGKFTGLETFMTGELFDLLSKKSILANNVKASSLSDETKGQFLKGLDLGFAGKISSNLFTIRSRHLIGGKSKEENYYMLSGMLIGAEVSYLKSQNGTIFCAAGESNYNLYKIALETLISDQKIVYFNDEMLKTAQFIGHRKILNLNDK